MTLLCSMLRFLCATNIVLSCLLIASHVENLSDLYSSLHRQHPKNNHTAVATKRIHHLLSNAMLQKRQTAAAGLVSGCPLLAILALSLLPMAFLSHALTTKPMHGSPARALVNRCDKLRLERARWFTTWFETGGRRTASR